MYSEKKIKTLTWKKGRQAPTGLILVLDATVLVEQFIRNHFKLLPLLRLGDLLQGLGVGDLLQLGARPQRVLLLPFLVLLPPLPLLLLVPPDLLLQLRHSLLVRALQLLLLGPDVEGRPAEGDGTGGGSLGAGLLPLTAGDPAGDDAIVGGATERGLLRILEGGEGGPLGGRGEGDGGGGGGGVGERINIHRVRAAAGFGTLPLVLLAAEAFVEASEVEGGRHD
ncbi:unnamed protein product [Musa acuminata subsp. malaccensis]|uniref:(wild Malaysian banana) hypothetical protein n=1 Tax=Musa acuminata subsp. malaccensis TaxID=214687 RepID=A0A8D7EY11_MUSAM|nr:unnamed protein product [Musa acuminata subsp. malaccensis]